jgi:2-polyprenyl-3-methyl-5-hydroxy-6-metoxy-1,4-benzoquinol methylase
MKQFSLDDDSAVLSLIENRQLRIADIGGGTGVTAAKLVKRGHVVTIIDPCRQMTDLAKKRNKSIRVINESMPCEINEQFDIILIRDCLHHVRRQREMIDFCIHMLAEGGMIIVNDFSPVSRRAKIIFLFERICFEAIKPVSETKLLHYFGAAGLQTELIRVNKRDYIVWGRKM